MRLPELPALLRSLAEGKLKSRRLQVTGGQWSVVSER
jgi:hypothetical protein